MSLSPTLPINISQIKKFSELTLTYPLSTHLNNNHNHFDILTLRLWADLLTPLFFLLSSLFSQAATLTVTNATDSGAGSLRETITLANPGDEIVFDGTLNGNVIFLENGQLTIDKDLSIDASNLTLGLTIDAEGQSRVLEIAPNSSVILRELAFTGGVILGGQAGAGIRNNRADLTLDDCQIFGNVASEGGGIYAFGDASLTLNNCTLSNNTAADSEGKGGSISLFGNATVATLNNCTLTQNSAGGGGGAIYSDGGSGNVSLNLYSCTLFENSGDTTGGGIFAFRNTDLMLNSCTLSRNSAAEGGGITIENNSTLSLNNTLLAGNTANTGPDLREVGTSVIPATTVTNNNLISNITGQDSLDLSTSGLIIAVDPLLSPLADYGGPTQTMHPLFNSDALLPGSTTRTDQRGISITGPPTVGAVKVGAIFEVANETELRTALTTPVPGTFILFDSALDGEAITLSGEQLVVPTSAEGLTISAANLINGVTIDANQQSRVMQIESNSSVALHSLTITRGRSNDGTDGNDGANGIDGIRGADGMDSVDGVGATNGANGGTGTNGDSGADGGIGDNGGGIHAGIGSIVNLTACTLSYNQSGNGGDGGVGGIGGNGADGGDGGDGDDDDETFGSGGRAGVGWLRRSRRARRSRRFRRFRWWNL